MLSERMSEWRKHREILNELKKLNRENMRRRIEKIRKRAKYWERAEARKW